MQITSLCYRLMLLQKCFIREKEKKAEQPLLLRAGMKNHVKLQANQQQIEINKYNENKHTTRKYSPFGLKTQILPQNMILINVQH